MLIVAPKTTYIVQYEKIQKFDASQDRIPHFSWQKVKLNGSNVKSSDIAQRTVL